MKKTCEKLLKSLEWWTCFYFKAQISNKFRGEVTNKCLQFDVERLEWSKISTMPTARSKSTSTLFQGHIVVSGGKANIDLQTVEQYIPSQNTWTKLPQMVNRKSLHALCSLNGKLFIVGRQCEVYDTTANRFCVLRSPISFNYVVINRNNCKISYSANRRTVQCFTKYMD